MLVSSLFLCLKYLNPKFSLKNKFLILYFQKVVSTTVRLLQEQVPTGAGPHRSGSPQEWDPTGAGPHMSGSPQSRISQERDPTGAGPQRSGTLQEKVPTVVSLPMLKLTSNFF